MLFELIAERYERRSILITANQPFSGWDICDTFPVEIVNGADSITGTWRVVGVRAIADEPGERLQVLVAPVLT
mgnify:CR=1 FL=1